MNNKEKLTELLKNNVYLQPSSIADYLLDNGVVPVVRCKECRYFVESAVSKTSFCKRQERMMRMRLDDYCSYGERRSDD